MNNTKLITQPRCGHQQLTGDCIYCLAHHLDTLRHLKVLLRKHIDAGPPVGSVVHVVDPPGWVKQKEQTDASTGKPDDGTEGVGVSPDRVEPTPPDRTGRGRTADPQRVRRPAHSRGRVK